MAAYYGVHAMLGIEGSSRPHSPVLSAAEAPSQTSPFGQQRDALHDRKRQRPKLSVPERASGWITVGSSGHVCWVAVFNIEPQIPVEPELETLKQRPRHGDGAPAAGIVHGIPSASRVGAGALAPHEPVRTLHVCPDGQCSLLEQNGWQPALSGVAPACEYQNPVQTKPARHALGLDGLQAAVHSVCAVGPSPIARHVEFVPPHWARSFA